ncbi:hypothetical protein D3C76_1156630 [compost metagenome]
MPELPSRVMSEPSPIVVEVMIKREPVASVSTLALKPATPNWLLMLSRTCCSVAPAGTLKSKFLPPCLMVKVVGLEPELTTVPAPPAKTLVETFDAVASLSTINLNEPLAAPVPMVTVATFSSEDFRLKPPKLLVSVMLVKAPRKASRAD